MRYTAHWSVLGILDMVLGAHTWGAAGQRSCVVASAVQARERERVQTTKIQMMQITDKKNQGTMAHYCPCHYPTGFSRELYLKVAPLSLPISLLNLNPNPNSATL